MQPNQTAAEIAREYEAMAINAANQHYHLQRRNPYMDFPALASHVLFCTLMQKTWDEIAFKLETGPEISEDEWGIRE